MGFLGNGVLCFFGVFWGVELVRLLGGGEGVCVWVWLSRRLGILFMLVVES